MALDQFKKRFYTEYNDINDKLALLNSDDTENLPKNYELISNRVQVLQKYFNDYTSYLSTYEQRKAQEHLNKLNNTCTEKRNILFPKKKFQFKSKGGTQQAKKEEPPIETKPAVDQVDAAALSLLDSHTCTIKDLENQTIIKHASELLNADIGIFNLKNCVVKLYGQPCVLHLSNIEDTTILCGPMSGTAFISKCKNSRLYLACHQLRIHESVYTDFYINVSSRSIIENCTNIRFGPYLLKYKSIEKDFQTSGLKYDCLNDQSWTQIDDFNWLVTNEQSPNWSFINENDRKEFIDDQQE